MFRFILAAFALMASIVPATAQTSLFTLAGTNNVTFSIATSPTPAVYEPGDFTVTDVAVTGDVNGLYEVAFFTNPYGGFDFVGEPGYGYMGPQLFSGSEQFPTFLSGVYTLDNGDILTISEVPEPAAWAMMLGGFAVAGVALRRRRRAAARSPA